MQKPSEKRRRRAILDDVLPRGERNILGDGGAAPLYNITTVIENIGLSELAYRIRARLDKDGLRKIQRRRRNFLIEAVAQMLHPDRVSLHVLQLRESYESARAESERLGLAILDEERSILCIVDAYLEKERFHLSKPDPSGE